MDLPKLTARFATVLQTFGTANTQKLFHMLSEQQQLTPPLINPSSSIVKLVEHILQEFDVSKHDFTVEETNVWDVIFALVATGLVTLTRVLSPATNEPSATKAVLTKMISKWESEFAANNTVMDGIAVRAFSEILGQQEGNALTMLQMEPSYLVATQGLETLKHLWEFTRASHPIATSFVDIEKLFKEMQARDRFYDTVLESLNSEVSMQRLQSPQGAMPGEKKLVEAINKLGLLLRQSKYSLQEQTSAASSTGGIPGPPPPPPPPQNMEDVMNKISKDGRSELLKQITAFGSNNNKLKKVEERTETANKKMDKTNDALISELAKTLRKRRTAMHAKKNVPDKESAQLPIIIGKSMAKAIDSHYVPFEGDAYTKDSANENVWGN
jgi:hypothetical protein